MPELISGRVNNIIRCFVTDGNNICVGSAMYWIDTQRVSSYKYVVYGGNQAVFTVAAEDLA